MDGKKCMLEVNHINAYYGESHILRNVSFAVFPGEVACLMGRNGVGKTTTLKVITGLLAVRSGTLKFDGMDITKLPTDRRARRGLAYVPQGREIIPHLTVRENLQLGFWARADAPSRSVEREAFEEVYQLFPKLTHILHRPGGVLSGGVAVSSGLPAPAGRVSDACAPALVAAPFAGTQTTTGSPSARGTASGRWTSPACRRE